jgi:hypothetical protein
MPEQMTNVFHKDASSEPPSTIKNSIWVCSMTEVPPPTIKNSIWVRVRQVPRSTIKNSIWVCVTEVRVT